MEILKKGILRFFKSTIAEITCYHLLCADCVSCRVGSGGNIHGFWEVSGELNVGRVYWDLLEQK